MDEKIISIAELRRHNLLGLFFQREAIADAVKQEVTTKEEEAIARHNFMKTNNLKSDKELAAWMQKHGWRQTDLEWQTTLPLRIQKHCKKNYRHKAEAHFLKRKNQLDSVVYSLLRVKDQFLANELYWRIDAQEANFGDLASTFAEGPERNTKGIVGPVPLSQAHPMLAEALRISKPGKLIEPIHIGEWWIVTRLENYNSASFDETMAERLSHELFDKSIEAEVARRIEITDITAGEIEAHD